MDSSKEVAVEVLPYIRVYEDGSFERLAGTEIAPPGLDLETGVESKDILILPNASVSARVYCPSSAGSKLPLILYLHGGAFIIASTADPKYHASLNALVAESNAILVSVDYRRAPEHPLPAAYEDSWSALRWITSPEAREEPWLRDHADFDRLFLVGDSCGANMAHHLAVRLRSDSDLGSRVKLSGMGMINPYFWGETPIGTEVEDGVRKALVDSWWKFVCVSGKGCDDPLINPFVDGAPSVGGIVCRRVLVVVSEKDILRDRGRLYQEILVRSGWEGTAEIMEVEGVDHVFHIFDPNCNKAKTLFQRLGSFVNGGGDHDRKEFKGVENGVGHGHGHQNGGCL